MKSSLEGNYFSVKGYKEQLHQLTAENFEQVALNVFCYQAKQNAIYAKYLLHLGISAEDIHSIYDIPFLPIRFFKSQCVASTSHRTKDYFESSGTTSQQNSKHYVFDFAFYEKNCIQTFEFFYGALSQYTFLYWLPSYEERKRASLIYMTNAFLQFSHSDSCYLLNDYKQLEQKVKSVKKGQKLILFGVAFGLLDLAEKYSINLCNAIIIETGGLKNRRADMLREELHGYLKDSFQSKNIHSEYGMTELFSQFYGVDGCFKAPPWAKLILRDITDPFSKSPNRIRGGINVIDLANIDTCCFIETEDLGKQVEGGFEVTGRLDFAELRGCNLLL